MPTLSSITLIHTLTMDLFEKVSEDIKTAMKAKDKVALDTLRNIKKVFLEAKPLREPTIP